MGLLASARRIIIDLGQAICSRELSWTWERVPGILLGPGRDETCAYGTSNIHRVRASHHEQVIHWAGGAATYGRWYIKDRVWVAQKTSVICTPLLSLLLQQQHSLSSPYGCMEEESSFITIWRERKSLSLVHGWADLGYQYELKMDCCFPAAWLRGFPGDKGKGKSFWWAVLQSEAIIIIFRWK